MKHKFDQTVMTLFAEVFCWLPLAATLDGGVFVTHGGLPAEDDCKLDDISAVRRYAVASSAAAASCVVVGQERKR